MAKVFENATLELVHVDEEKGTQTRLKSVPYLVEQADEEMVKSVGVALATLLDNPVSHATVITRYRHTLA